MLLCWAEPLEVHLKQGQVGQQEGEKQRENAFSRIKEEVKRRGREHLAKKTFYSGDIRHPM